jgi:hypothetical protein
MKRSHEISESSDESPRKKRYRPEFQAQFYLLTSKLYALITQRFTFLKRKRSFREWITIFCAIAEINEESFRMTKKLEKETFAKPD